MEERVKQYKQKRPNKITKENSSNMSFAYEVNDRIGLVLWLANAFPESWFTNSLCAHLVSDRSTDVGWHNLSGTFDGLKRFIGASFLGVGNTKTRKISVNS